MYACIFKKYVNPHWAPLIIHIVLLTDQDIISGGEVRRCVSQVSNAIKIYVMAGKPAEST